MTRTHFYSNRIFLSLTLALLVMVGFVPFAVSGELSIGAVGAVTVSPYKSYDTRVMPFPFVTYKSDRFFIKGTSLGVHLLKNERHELSIGASYLGMEFKPSRTDDTALRWLDRRRSTIMADALYSYVSKIGLIRAGVSQDVLGQSDGTLAALSLHVPWMTERFVVMPGLGVQWASSKHNEYYYEISRPEAARSGLKDYSPGNTFSPFLTLEAKLHLNDRWDLVAKGKVEYLPGRIQDSPMVGKTFQASIMAGVQFNF